MDSTAAMAEALLSNIGADLPGMRDIDYKDESDGLMHCGVCREPKQKRLVIPIGDLGERIVRVQCRCDRERYAEEERQRKLQEDRERISRLRHLSLMDEKVRDSTFENFQINEENARPLKLCKRYATAFDEMVTKNQGLLFWGNPGTGKTFAAACIANYLLDRLQPVVMTSFVKLISELQTNRDGEDEESIIRRMNRASLLIIDSRYRARKPMLLTTNLSLQQMQSTQDIRYGRIYDRVFEVCYPVEFKGQSWRYVEAAKRYDEMKTLLEG